MDEKKIKSKFDDEWLEHFLKTHERDLIKKKKNYGSDTTALHICPVLRILILRIYICRFIYDIKKEDIKKLDIASNILLDDILFVNQNIIRAIKKNRNSDKSIFPDYFEEISIEEKDECMNKTEEYILSKKPLEFNEYDIRPYYKEILNLLKLIDIDDKIFNRILEHCEYGIYLGFLMKIETDKINNNILKPNPSERSNLESIRDKFKYGMKIRENKLYEYFNNRAS